MALAMIRPYRHPKTGMYWVRKVVPGPLRAIVGKGELIESLGTKDCAEAKAKAGPVVARFEAIIAAARHGGGGRSEHEIERLCQGWYRDELAYWWDDPGEPSQWATYRDLLHDQVERFDDPELENNPDVVPRVFLKPEDRTEAAALLAKHGHLPDDDKVSRTAECLFDAKLALCDAMEPRAASVAAEAKAQRFPSSPSMSPQAPLSSRPERSPKAAGRVPEAAAPTAVPMLVLVNAWAAESGTAGKALYDRQRTATMLAGFLGHDDAARVTAEDVVRWKEARLAAGRSTKTVANDIGELRPIWSWGRANRKLTLTENPFAGLAPRTKKRAGLRVRGPYTDEEARQLLQAARAEHDASLRWLPWTLCFTGARLGELTQSLKEDVQQENGGPWFVHIHAQGTGRTLKTVQSERMVPLHPALVEEGFLRHVQSLPAGTPLFPDLTPDKFGMLKGTATKKHGYWVRHTVGITDRSKDPAHAWRHRFEDQARRAGVPQNVTDGLMGHLNAANEAEGYGRGFRFMPDTTALWVAKMTSPLPPVATNDGTLLSLAPPQGAQPLAELLR